MLTSQASGASKIKSKWAKASLHGSTQPRDSVSKSGDEEEEDCRTEEEKLSSIMTGQLDMTQIEFGMFSCFGINLL